MRLLRDDDQLISVRTQDYRTLDQHFVSPIVYTEGERIVVRLSCNEPVGEREQCREAVYVGGTIRSEPKKTPSPSPPASPSPTVPATPTQSASP